RFVEWFSARTKGEVLWVDPYPTRLPAFADLRRSASTKVENEARHMPAGLTVLRPSGLPIEPLAGSGYLHRILWGKLLDTILAFAGHGDCVIGVGKPSELALQALKRTAGVYSLYDAMDDFPAFYSGLSRR